MILFVCMILYGILYEIPCCLLQLSFNYHCASHETTIMGEPILEPVVVIMDHRSSLDSRVPNGELTNSQPKVTLSFLDDCKGQTIPFGTIQHLLRYNLGGVMSQLWETLKQQAHPTKVMAHRTYPQDGPCYYSAYFFYYSQVSLHFLVLFMSPIILFQHTFTFIYSTFSKKKFSFSKISKSQTDPTCF